jgi:hypothetical protein
MPEVVQSDGRQILLSDECPEPLAHSRGTERLTVDLGEDLIAADPHRAEGESVLELELGVSMSPQHCDGLAVQADRAVPGLRRNLATSLHRLAGATNVAAALRHHGRNPLRPLQLLKIN